MEHADSNEKLLQRLQQLESEHQRLKEELEMSVAKLQAEKSKSEAIVAAIGDPVIIIDRKYQVIYQNDLSTNLFGDNTGKSCFEVYQGRSEVCEVCAVTATWEDGKIHKTDKVMSSPDGRRYVEICASPLRNADGEIFAGIEIVRDVTKRKLTEERLLQANGLLKSILESTADGILAVGADGELLGYNRNFMQLWNIPPAIMENFNDETVLNSVLKQLEHPDVFLRRLKNLYANPQTIDMDVIHFKDGRMIERYTKPLLAAGDYVGRVWSFRDITRIRRDEIEKRQLIDELQNALSEVKKLSGFFPICSHCKKIRDDKGYWNQIETYIKEHSEAEFSHGVCPDCLRKYYPELA